MRPVAAAVALAVLAPVALADDLKARPASAKPTELAALIAQLGDRDYATREAAMKALHDLGPQALPDLRAAAASDVPEVAERANQLAHRIQHKLDNERALAPSVVDLPGDERTLQVLLDLIEKQTRYKVRVNGDQAVLAQAVKVPAGKRSFWEAVGQVGEAAGLTVDSASGLWGANDPRVSVTDTTTNQTGRALADAVERLTLFRKALTHHQEQIVKYTAQLKGAKDDEKKRLEGLIADEKRMADKYEKQIADIEVRYGLKVDAAVPLGTVVLHARPKGDTTAVCQHGAVRVEARPPTADVLKRYGPTHLPVALTVLPEPRMHWQRVTEAVVFEATGGDGRPLTPSHFNPAANTPLANDELQFRRAKLGLRDSDPMPVGPVNMGFAAVTATAPTPTTLKSVRGLIRGSVWTQSGDIVTARGLDAENEKHAAAYGTELSASIQANDSAPPNSTTVQITLRYNPADVRPFTGTPDGDGPVWLENRGGRAVVAPPAKPKVPANPYGLVAWGTDGERLPLNSTSGTTSHYEQRDGRLIAVQKLRYVLLDVGGASGKKLAAVSFHGSRLQEVTVPFKLTDVPTAPGTGDGKPTEVYPTWKR